MTLINDNLDPSGYGMFSKAGRFTTEKYSVFRKKDEILLGRPKYLQVSYFPTFEMAWNDEDEESQEGINKKWIANIEKDEDHHIIKRPEISTFEKQTSRTEHFIAKQREKLKMLGPPLGLYHPKKVEKHKKCLPVYSTEVKLRPYINRFQMINSKELEEKKDIDLQKSEGMLSKKIPGSLKLN